jgi:hypothetical protein
MFRNDYCNHPHDDCAHAISGFNPNAREKVKQPAMKSVPRGTSLTVNQYQIRYAHVLTHFMLCAKCKL